MGRQKSFTPEIKTTRMSKHPTLDLIVDAYVRYLSGESLSAIAKDTKLNPNILQDRFKRLDLATNTKLPTLSVERRLISEVLSDKLKPIKEELSINAVNILRETDDVILKKIKEERESLKLSDLVKAADSYEGRLARITGMEQDPNSDGKEDPNARVNIFINEMFPSHSKNLSNAREQVNGIVSDINNIKPNDIKPNDITPNK